MLELHGKIAVLQDGLTQIQLDIQNIYAYMDSLSSNSINPTLIDPSDLRSLFHDIKDQLRSHLRLS